MTRPLSPAELHEFAVKDLRTPEQIREAWCRALEAQGARQCIGAFGPNLATGQPMVCALVLLGEIVHGSHAATYSAHEASRQAMKNRFFTLPPFYKDLGDRVGLSQRQVIDVMNANDGDWGPNGDRNNRKSFREIAKLVRSWFA